MDTKQKANLDIQVNSFSKGMNSDSSYDLVPTEQYIFGKNIRITNNTLIAQDIDSNTTEGGVSPIYIGKKQVLDITCDRILAVDSIEKVGVVIVEKNDKWEVFRLELKDDKIERQFLFRSTNKPSRKKFSIVLHKELEDVIKLYIADGKNPVLQLNIDDVEYCQKIYNVNNPSHPTIYDNEDLICSNRIFPTNQIKIANQITGTLKTQQVQYVYRFYKKYGITSKLSPFTSKIHVIDSSRKSETGNAENTYTTIGFRLKLDLPDYVKKIFSHVQLFRLSYITPKNNAEINLVYDAEIDVSSDFMYINDNGFKPLQEYSLEEFDALQNQTVIPQSIESNQGYLFGANIKDESLINLDSSVDFRAFSVNRYGECTLYKNEFLSEPRSYQTYEIKNGEVDLEHSFNPYSDINIQTNQQALESRYGQRFIIDDGNCYLGGFGKNIEYRIVAHEVSLDSDVTGIDSKQNTPHQVNTTRAILDTDSIKYIRYDISTKKYSYENSATSLKQYYDKSSLFIPNQNSYKDLIVSSKSRSLRRDETYRYGIVLYDKYGRRTETNWIADIKAPSVQMAPPTRFDEDTKHLYAYTLGVEFNVTLPKKIINDYNIVSYEIVRCEICSEFSSILTQVAISRPVRQKFKLQNYEPTYTPYYPSGFLTSEVLCIEPSYGNRTHTEIKYTLYDHDEISLSGDVEEFYRNNMWQDRNAANKRRGPAITSTLSLLEIFNAEIQILRNDLLSELSQDKVTINPLYYAYESDAEIQGPRISANGRINVDDEVKDYRNKVFYKTDNAIIIDTTNIKTSDKSFNCYTFCDYRTKDDMTFIPANIVGVTDTKNPQWFEGFSNLEIGGDGEVAYGIKQYKGFLSSVSNIMYNNWVSSSYYDCRLSKNETQVDTENENWESFVFSKDAFDIENSKTYKAGPIGPGPQSFLIKMDRSLTISSQFDKTYLGTAICNICHHAVQFAGVSRTQKQYDTYYGFGNYTNLENEGDRYTGNSIVYDGNIYITPCEITTLFKAFDFNDCESLRSTQITYYVPLESTINTYFDYGMNYTNTASPNLQLKSGDIEGVSTQDRPLHQYNMIYSDNSMSNNVFVAKNMEKDPESFPHRIIYSMHKTDGERTDSWSIFKPVDFIDASTNYGEITNLLTNKDVIYYWQTSAFGKLSVNERSLVKDQNSNTIQLGQGDILQRTDYIDTKYGMRKDDYCAIAADTLYWIDINNKAIVQYTGERVLNISETYNVQNILNKNISLKIPTIQYDLENNELLCGCLEGGQLVFNTKYQMFTSVYNRDYDDIIEFNNVLYSLFADEEISYRQLNNLQRSYTNELLTPQQLSFIVNKEGSITKVFDDQKVVTYKRNFNTNIVNTYFDTRRYTYETDICDKTYSTNTSDCITDREGNIQYPIPRCGNGDYGDRIRGKWMKVDINMEPQNDFVISHILTKFRQSFI